MGASSVDPGLIHLIAVYVVVPLMAVCGLVATVVPTVRWIGRVAGWLAQARSRPKLGPTRGLSLCEFPLRPDLDEPMRGLAADTRALLLNLDHERAGARRWLDGVPDGAVSDAAYEPTIAMTSEVWQWLRHADGIGRRDGPLSDELRDAVEVVRGALLSEASVWTRLDAILRAIEHFDRELRTQSTTPYRGQRPRAGIGLRPDGESSEDRERHRLYDELLEAHGSAIEAIVARHAHDASARDDLRQEIHLAIWKALPAYRGDASLKTYVLRIARNRGINFSERQPAHLPAPESIDPAPELGEQLDERQRQRAIGTAIAQLPEALRKAIELRLEGLSYREIGAALGITETNASVRVTRARKALRRSLA